jgi:cytochrome c oxidase subunit 2
VPGLTTHYRITPTRLGTYPVVCAELCGLGHSTMRSTTKVVTPAEFNAWIAQQKAPAGAGGTTTAGGGTSPGGTSPGGATTGGAQTAALDGKKLFEDNGCGGCHTLADAGTNAQVGPVLDKVLKGKDANFIATSIKDPSAFVESGFQDIMPKTYGSSLSPQELDALVKYLGKVAAK